MSQAKRFTIAALIVGLAVAAYASLRAPAPAIAAGGKNLQVLSKDMSKSDVKKLMKTWTKSLGVKCNYCHKTSNMATDTEKKKVARQMLRMVNTINGRHLKRAKRKVSCKSCHRGKKKPSR